MVGSLSHSLAGHKTPYLWEITNTICEIQVWGYQAPKPNNDIYTTIPLPVALLVLILLPPFNFPWYQVCAVAPHAADKCTPHAETKRHQSIYTIPFKWSVLWMLNHAQWIFTCGNRYVNASCREDLCTFALNGHVKRQLHSPTEKIQKKLRMPAVTIGSFSDFLFFLSFSLRSFTCSFERRDASTYRSSSRRAAPSRRSAFRRDVFKCWVSRSYRICIIMRSTISLVLQKGCLKGLVRSSKSWAGRNRLLAALDTYFKQS